MVTISDVHEWLKTSKHGDRLVYHVGRLAYDREPNAGPKATVIGQIADKIYKAFEDGRVTLHQTKATADQYIYTAVRTEQFYDPR